MKAKIIGIIIAIFGLLFANMFYDWGFVKHPIYYGAIIPSIMFMLIGVYLIFKDIDKYGSILEVLKG